MQEGKRESGVAFIDKEALAKSSPTNAALLAEIPEALKPLLGGAQPHQLAIYEHFRIVRSGAGTQQPGAYSNLDASESKMADVRGGAGGSGSASALTASQASEAYTIVMHRMDAALRRLQQQKVKSSVYLCWASIMRS